MVLFSVYDPDQSQVVKIPSGRRVRDIGGYELFAVTKGEMGEWLVESYELPFSCEVVD